MSDAVVIVPPPGGVQVAPEIAALVSGGASGLGAATVRALAARAPRWR